VRALLALLLLTATAAAGTPPAPAAPRKHTIVIVEHDAPKPVVIHIDGKLQRIKLVKLATTPPPACKTDRFGNVRCAITY
jgi:hypothetical protein